MELTIRFLRFRFFLRSSDAVSLHVTLRSWVRLHGCCFHLLGCAIMEDLTVDEQCLTTSQLQMLGSATNSRRVARIHFRYQKHTMLY
jgi:hypothetical protein